MKKSNMMLISLCVLLISGALITDLVLADRYRAIDLKDPYLNFHDVPVKPFKALVITGGNSYAIRVRQGSEFNIKLRNSRKSFFSMQVLNDTLSINFSVANFNARQQHDYHAGIIITVPALANIRLAGTSTELGPFRQDSLSIQQTKNAVTRLNKIQVSHLNLGGELGSMFDCQSDNEVLHLTLNLKNNASILMQQIRFKTFSPSFSDSANVVLFRQSLGMLMLKDSVNL